MKPTRAPDDPRDPHLLAALRNAPDRDAAPTAQLSAAILAQARHAVHAAAPSAPRWRAWQAAFERLWQPAPMAAFGTLAMAAVIGVMWQGQELPEASPGSRPQRAAAPSTPPAQPAPPRDITRPVPPAVQQASTPSEAQAPKAAARPAEKATVNPAPRQAQAPAPAMPGAQEASAAPAAGVRGDIAAERREALGKTLADSARPSSRASAQAQPDRLAAAESTPIEPLSPAANALDAALRSNPASVQWRVSPQRVLAHDGEQRAWWAALQSATAGRWQIAAPVAASGAEPAALTLLIDGAPGGSIGFEAQAVRWTDASGSAWRARLGAAELRALQEVLARW